MIRLNIVSVLFLSGVALTSTAVADSRSDNQGFYTGAGTGVYYVDFDDVSFDERAASLRAFGGYRFNEYLAVELGYSKFFETSDRVLGAKLDVDGDAWDISLRPTLPVSDNVDLYAVGGYTRYEFDAKVRGAGLAGSLNDHDRDVLYGLGGAFRFNNTWQVRGEWTAVNVNDADFGTVMLSASYSIR